MQNRIVYGVRELFSDFTYPAGEPHIKLKEDVEEWTMGKDDQIFVVANVRDYNGLAKVWLADKLLKDFKREVTFVLPYLPFARHDRPNDVFDTSPLQAVSHILDGVDYITVDLHSDALGVNQFHQSEIVDLLYRPAGLFDSNPVFVIPDAGATKKAYSWIKPGQPVVQAIKKRDPQTGKLSGFQIIDPTGLVYMAPCVIVDDICDGGGTFIGLAEELEKKNARELRLAVTHGLFTKGLTDLFKHFDMIYTLNIYNKYRTNKVKYLNLKHLIENGEYF